MPHFISVMYQNERFFQHRLLHPVGGTFSITVYNEHDNIHFNSVKCYTNPLLNLTNVKQDDPAPENSQKKTVTELPSTQPRIVHACLLHCKLQNNPKYVLLCPCLTVLLKCS